MLTTFDQDEYVWQALKAGASGFLLKDVPPEDLAGRSARSPAVTRSRARDHAPADRGFSAGPEPGALPTDSTT